MDQDTQKYYEDLISMFAMPAWKELIRDYDEIEIDLNDIIQTIEDLYYKRGKRQVYADLITLEDRTRDALDELENPSEVEDEAFI